MTSTESGLSKTSYFLNLLKRSTKEEVEHLLESLQMEKWAVVLEELGSVIKQDYVEGFGRNGGRENDLVSYNFLELFIGLLDLKRLSRLPKLLSTICDLLAFIGHHKPAKYEVLESMGIITRFNEILKYEETTENFIFTYQDYQRITIAHLITQFFPALPNAECYECVDSMTGRILSVGRDLNKPLNFVDTIFEAVSAICLKSNCHPVYHALLLKLTFYSISSKLPFNYIGVLHIVNLLMSSEEKPKAIIGLAIIRTMMSRHFNLIQQFRKTRDTVRFIIGPLKWAEDIYEALTETPKMLIYCLQDKTLSSERHFRNYLMLPVLQFIVPNYAKSSEHFQASDLKKNCAQLTKFMKIILNIPKEETVGRLEMHKDGLQMFQAVVALVIKTLEDNGIENIMKENIQVVEETNDARLPDSPERISLEFIRYQNFNKALGPSSDPIGLSEDLQSQCLRLLLIFHEVNENCGVLFSSLTPEPLIDRNCFVSQSLVQDVKYNFESNCIMPGCIRKNLQNYFYLLPFKARQELINLKEYRNNENIEMFRISRKSILNDVSKLDLLKHWDKSWQFRFIEDPLAGPGPTKEFYTEFSRECQRYDLNLLWIGDPVKDSNGISCVIPKPKLSLYEEPESLLKNIGLIFAKSFMDGHIMSIHFSEIFCKTLVIGPLSHPISVWDLQDIMPDVLAKFSNVLNKKWEIENDDLTMEERALAMANIKFDGSTFEDIRLNFTFPGFPEIELKEGGKDIFLSIGNIEEYLKLLTWWVLCQRPLKIIVDSMESVFPDKYLSLFYFDEIETLFCGLKEERWTVEYLKSNCIINKAVSSQTAEHLLEVLTSLSTTEQRQFLQFVTGTPRLPNGGLKSLSPQLNVKYKRNVVGFPDVCLPTSWTCTNTLFISNYDSREILRERLLYASTYHRILINVKLGPADWAGLK